MPVLSMAYIFSNKVFNTFRPSLLDRLKTLEEQTEKVRLEIIKVQGEIQDTENKIIEAQTRSGNKKTELDRLENQMNAYWQKKGNIVDMYQCRISGLWGLNKYNAC